jgi:hypothetical protein
MHGIFQRARRTAASGQLSVGSGLEASQFARHVCGAWDVSAHGDQCAVVAADDLDDQSELVRPDAVK